MRRCFIVQDGRMATVTWTITLSTLLESVIALPFTPFISRDELIRALFHEGYQYQLILCFLVAVYGICMSLRTLKRSLKRQHLKRRGDYSNHRDVERYLMVCLYHSLTVITLGTHINILTHSLSYASLVPYWDIEPCTRG